MSACPFCNELMPKAYTPSAPAELIVCLACGNPFVVRSGDGAPETAPFRSEPDIRGIAPEGSIGAAILEVLPQAIDNLPILPEISQRVLKMCSDPDVTMNDLAEVIREEQAIALAIMRLANSAMFGGLHEIKDLNAACARLGMKSIANVVQTVASNNLYVTGDKRLKEFMRKLWRHSIATAHCAFQIAQQTSEPRAETLFLAGLIHSIGKVLLLDIITGSYSGAIGKLRVTPEVLREVIESFHPLLGLHVAHRWELPPEFGAIIYCQQDPGSVPHEEWIGMAHIVSFASIIATVEGYGMYEAEESFISTSESAQYLNMTDLKIAALRVDLADQIEAIFSSVSPGAPA